MVLRFRVEGEGELMSIAALADQPAVVALRSSASSSRRRRAARGTRAGGTSSHRHPEHTHTRYTHRVQVAGRGLGCRQLQEARIAPRRRHPCRW
jgi:hypothetical protein